jgi:hypothetical protein
VEVSTDHTASSVKQQQRRVRYWRARQAELVEQQQERAKGVAEFTDRALPPLLDAAYHSYASAQVSRRQTARESREFTCSYFQFDCPSFLIGLICCFGFCVGLFVLVGQSAAAEARLKRIEDGESSWDSISAELVQLGFLPSKAALSNSQSVASMQSLTLSRTASPGQFHTPRGPHAMTDDELLFDDEAQQRAVHAQGAEPNAAAYASSDPSERSSPSKPVHPLSSSTSHYHAVSPAFRPPPAPSSSLSSAASSLTSSPRMVALTGLSASPQRSVGGVRLPPLAIASNPRAPSIKMMSPQLSAGSSTGPAFASFVLSPVLSPALEPAAGCVSTVFNSLNAQSLIMTSDILFVGLFLFAGNLTFLPSLCPKSTEHT